MYGADRRPRNDPHDGDDGPPKGTERMNNRLYVGNLSYDTTTDELRACFSEVGNVTDTHVVKDRETGRARGFAFVTMATEDEATHAVAQLNGAMFGGRALRVNVAEERSSGRGGGGHRGW